MVGYIGLKRVGWGASGGGISAWQALATYAASEGWDICYDPTNPDTRTMNGGDVASIASPLGTYGAVVQAVEAAQPELVPGFFGAFDGMRFTSTEFLNLASLGGTEGQPNISIALARYNTTGGTSRAVVDGVATSPRNLLYVTGGSQYGLYAGTTVLGSSILDTIPRVIWGLFDGGSSIIAVDGAEVAGATGTQGISGINIGATYDGTGKWIGEIGPVLFRFDGNVTAARAMADFLAAQAGITMSP